jgi:Mg2+ and Co2+ transporter CorA
MSDEKTDFMNRTLYTLTLITALATPLMFLTGLFGMNFTDMKELVPARAS